MSIDAHQVLKALENDLIRDEFRPTGLFLTEIQAPNSDRRADAIWMTARTARITGYEVKVSRSDLKAELRDPTKCEPWLKYCDQWWLVVGDETILIGLMDEIPEDWGICTPPTSPNRRMMKVIREAPMLAPADKAPVLGKLISHQSYRALDLQREVEQANRRADMATKRADQRDQSHLEYLQRQANPFEKKFAEVAEEYDKIRAENDYSYHERLNHVSAEVIARAIVAGKEGEKLTNAAKNIASNKLRQIERALNSLADSFELRQLKDLLIDVEGES